MIKHAHSDWKCAGCGKAHPDLVRACDCATNVLYRMDGKNMLHEVKIPTEQDRWDDALAEASKIDMKLPCDVMVAPHTVIRRGCNFSTLLVALSRRHGLPDDERVRIKFNEK